MSTYNFKIYGVQLLPLWIKNEKKSEFTLSNADKYFVGALAFYMYLTVLTDVRDQCSRHVLLRYRYMHKVSLLFLIPILTSIHTILLGMLSDASLYHSCLLHEFWELNSLNSVSTVFVTEFSTMYLLWF